MARRIAREEGLKHVYIGNIRMKGAGDTLCPRCAKPVIRRTGYLVTENSLKNGRCGFCGSPVHGLW